MRELKNTCRAAIVQATPVMFDKARSLEKALTLIDEAARNGAEIIVFPELFLPGYPLGHDLRLHRGQPARPQAVRTGSSITTTPCWPMGRSCGAHGQGPRAGIYLSMAIPSVTPSPARCTTPT